MQERFRGLMERGEFSVDVRRFTSAWCADDLSCCAIQNDYEAALAESFAGGRILGPAHGGVHPVVADEKLSGEGAGEIDLLHEFAFEIEGLDLVLVARTDPDERVGWIGSVDRDPVGIGEFAERSEVLAAPVPHDRSVERVLEDEVGCVTIHDENISVWRDGGVARHELAGGHVEAGLFGGWEASHDGSIGFENRDASFLRFRGPTLCTEVPSTVDVDEVFGSVSGENVNAVSSDQACAERADERAVFFEHEERVLRVIGHQIEQPIFSFDHGVTVDHGGDFGVGFAPGRIDAISSGAVSEGGALIGNGLSGRLCCVPMAKN